MKCPRDGAVLDVQTIDGVTLDLCHSCGGLWLDRFELDKLDEPHEALAAELASFFAAHTGETVDHEQRLSCPHHPEVVMMRRFFSVRRQVELDECPQCAGIWLDAGELSVIRGQFSSEDERRAAAEAAVAGVLASHGAIIEPRQKKRYRGLLRALLGL